MGSLYRVKVKREDGALYESPVWHCKYRKGGKLYRRTTGETDEAKAKAKMIGWEGDPRSATPEADRMKFEEMVTDFLTDYQINGKRSLDRAERSVKHLKAFFTGQKVLTITTADVRAYVKKRQEQKAANATVNRELAALKRMLNLALQSEKIPRRPYIPMLRENNVRKGFVGEIEYLGLREKLPTYLRAPADLAYTFGWRKAEVFSLTWPQVDLVRGTVRLEPGTTKNDEGRTVTLTAGLWATLRTLQEETTRLEKERGEKIPWVFHRNGEQIKDFYQAWRTASKEAKVGRLLFHDFRRSAVRNMERAGIPRSVAMKLTGHKTESVYRRYAVVDEGQLRDAARRLEAGAAGVPVGQEGQTA